MRMQPGSALAPLICGLQFHALGEAQPPIPPALQELRDYSGFGGALFPTCSEAPPGASLGCAAHVCP